MELRNLVNTKVEEAGGNKRKGYKLAAQHLGNLIDEGKLSAQDFSFKHMFEELVDVPISEEPAIVAESLNTSAFPTIASRIIHSDIIDEYNLALGEVGNLVRERKATRTDQELVAGFTAGDTTPLIRRQSMAYEETGFGEKYWTIYMADFGRLISLTREVIYEDRTGEVLDRARDIGRAAGQHKQKMIVQTIEGIARTAFAESSFLGAVHKGSAITLYSADHDAIDGQTNINLATTNALADYTDVDAVWQLVAKLVDEAGNPIDIVPTAILIPGAVKATAFKIFRSDLLLAHGNTDTANIPTYNPVNDLGRLNIVSSVYMASTSTWYMGDFAKQLLWLNVFPPATASQGADSELAFTNQIVARFRFNYHGGVGHTDYRYITKSTT